MRDERGKKKLEVLISSSSQVKILLTMDDQRGRKGNQTGELLSFKEGNTECRGQMEERSSHQGYQDDTTSL